MGVFWAMDDWDSCAYQDKTRWFKNFWEIRSVRLRGGVAGPTGA